MADLCGAGGIDGGARAWDKRAVLRLASTTDPRWVDVALGDLDRLLVDHAHCEHKAAVTALSFVSKYPDDDRLVTALAALAEEEAGHFKELVGLIAARGLPLGHPDPDPYVQGLLSATRKGTLEHRVDRLLCCALIEGRSCERLQRLAELAAHEARVLAACPLRPAIH